MSLKETDSIDMVVAYPHDQRMSLVIMDVEPVGGDAEREQALRRKLAVYAAYVASGAFKRDNPDTDEKDVVVDVVCAYPPTPGMLDIDRLRHKKATWMAMPVSVISVEEFCQRYSFSVDDLGQRA